MSEECWYHADLTNWLPLGSSGDIVCFEGLLVIQPNWGANIGPDQVTAKLRVSSEVPVPNPGGCLPLMLVPVVCDLLSFASRRAVSFSTDEDWWQREHAARGADEQRGPVETLAEVRLLIERALPTLMNQATEDQTKLRTGLRWFLLWPQQSVLEMRYVVLWIVLEMMAKAYWRGNGNAPRNDLKKVRKYLRGLALPGLQTVPLKSFYKARNAIVHGDPDKAYHYMRTWFGDWARKHQTAVESFEELLKASVIGFEPAGSPITPRRTADPYNSALNQGCFFLSRVIEKMFLARWGCDEFSFYGQADYFATSAP